MRWRPHSDAPVDLHKHRGRAAPNIDIRRTLAEIERNAKVLRGRHLQLEPELLATPAKPLVGTLPELKGPSRDLRIDVCRGIALWCIFLNHVPNNIGSWLTLRNYGFSDGAEVFMFVSGVTCALAYGQARSRDGWNGVISRTLSRSWDISDFDYRYPGYPTNTDGFARGISDELEQCRFFDDTKPHS